MNFQRRLVDTLLSSRGDRANTRLHNAMQNLSPFGKMLLYTCIAGLILSTTALLHNIYIAGSTEIPARGGEIHEGILGIPRFANPLFALSHADRDLSELVYAGLFTYNNKGEIIPEIADRYAISDDGTTYTITLKEAYFHDGVRVTADDVVYTVRQIQNPLVKSTIQGNWNGVSVRSVNERTVEFTLSEQYAPFIHNLTIGILPSHIWEPIGAERLAFSEENIRPIGAGPYRIRSARTSRDGTRSYYTLSSFDKYVLGESLIPRVELTFFADRDDLVSAFNRGSISSSAYLPESLAAQEEKTRILPVRRIFGLFFSEEESPLSDIEVRKALDIAAEKDFLVRSVFSGFATPIDAPQPFVATYKPREGSANDILDDAGWERGDDNIRYSGDTPLSFSIATANAEELVETGQVLKRNFENIGAQVTLNTYTTEVLLGEVIRPREYDALLFGQVIGRDGDLFGYWHSSQRNDPGLNIALYSNETVDDLLESMRTNPSREVYARFNEEVQDDLPAIFLYHPNLPYVLPDVHGVKEHDVVAPHERFIDIHQWYIETQRRWGKSS
ncbi:MAG: peptide ABC transporter substrate-binding protein [Candidatus Paceibacterota bacterium]